MSLSNLLNEAQGGRVYANLARAFQLPAAKVEAAVAAMVHDLTFYIHQDTLSRQRLAGLVHLLGQPDYENVLETPTLLGATHTQTVGNDALLTIAGREASRKMVRNAAAAADISEMIVEYLLPVVAVMIVGALEKASHVPIEDVMRRISHLMNTAPPAPANNPKPQPLPNVAGGQGFSGITGSMSSEASETARARRYDDLADVIRLRERTRDGYDPAKAVRRILSPILGFPANPWIWLGRMQRWSLETIKTISTSLRR